MKAHSSEKIRIGRGDLNETNEEEPKQQGTTLFDASTQFIVVC
jgi:hypothetical protein